MLIIDGHNLIPCVPGLSLEDVDDEVALIKMLQTYARVKRKTNVVVFFDGAPVGKAGSRAYGIIHARFVPFGNTADDAIRAYLKEQGPAARAAVVVSNDRMVQRNAKELRAGVVSSTQFAQELLSTVTASGEGPSGASLPGTMKPAAKKSQPAPKPAAPAKGAAGAGKLDEWYDLFNLSEEEAEKPIEPPSGPRRRPRRTSSPPATQQPSKKPRR